MFSKIKFLFVIFAIHWLEGDGYFFRRRESTPLTSDSQTVSSTPNHNEYRMNSFSWIQPGHQAHQAPVANNGHVAASIPLPIAIQLPHQFIPLTVFPTIAQIQPVSKGYHHHNAVFPQPVAPAPNTTPTPFVKFSPYESQQNSPYQLAAAQAPLQTVRFVPCLCGGSKDDRWSKTNYQANVQFPNNVPVQAIQLLPCYCPLVRDVDSQYVQPVVLSSTDSATNNGPSTASTKFSKR